MPHLDTWAVSGLLVLLGSFELLAGRMLNRRQSDELAVDAISLAQFALLIKPAIIAGAALILAQLAPSAAGQLGSLPLWQAVLLVIIPADFMHYWYHRLGHTVPFMWHMHRTHHTATAMSISVAYRENWRWFLFMPDIWYAGALVYLGLGEAVLIAHLIFGCANVLVHSAFAWDKVLYKWRWLVPFTWLLERLVQLPSTHRAHHAELDEHGQAAPSQLRPVAVHLGHAVRNREFTHDRYPERYGIPNDPGDPWCVQLWWPFCRSRKADSEYR